jgi:hypothetical protein
MLFANRNLIESFLSFSFFLPPGRAVVRHLASLPPSLVGLLFWIAKIKLGAARDF